MRLTTATGALPPSATFPQALRQAVAARGHAPAVTLVNAHGRSEQGMASIAQWTAKGAHLLQGELGLQPGAMVELQAPPSWTVAVVCMAGWWSGLRIRIADDEATQGTAAIIVRSEHHAHPTTDSGDDRIWWVGSGFDGAPSDPQLRAWTVDAQWMPDALPPPRPDDGPALTQGRNTWTMAQLLARARDWPAGTVGIDATATPSIDALIAIAVRPAATGYPTVVIDGVDRAEAAGDRVAYWCEPGLGSSSPLRGDR